MISILTVEINGCRRHLDLLMESVVKHSKLVSEFIIAVSDAQDHFYEEWDKNNIKFKRFSNPVESLWYGHGLGLKAALDHATQEYVMFSDPDTFWYMPVEELYLQLIKKYNINYVGVSHHNGINQCFSYFPYVINSMAKRSTLPDKEWLKGELKFRGAFLHRAQLLPENRPDSTETDPDPGKPANGEFLIPGVLPNYNHLFPNKDDYAIFDVGSNMWLWNEEVKGRWLSFQTLDCHIYTTHYYRNNFGLKEKLPKQNIIYHLGSGSRNEEVDWLKFKEEYDRSDKND